MNRISTTEQIRVTDVCGETGTVSRMIELNRPEKLNCLSLKMLDALRSALEQSNADRIILTGAGRAFCTGLDLDEVAGPDGGKGHLQRLVSVYRWMLNTRSATLALAGGYAVGGGAGLVACARTAIVSSDFRFRLPGGDLSRLASVVLPVCNLRCGGKAPEGTGWLGCDLDADEARRIGLVDRIVSPGELSELIESIRKGHNTPEILQQSAWEKQVLNTALSGLDRFLQDLKC